MAHWQEHHGSPPGFERHSVIDATTGRVVLERATSREFDRWYDHHCFWREPRSIEEINPDLRARYANRGDLEPDETRLHFLVND